MSHQIKWLTTQKSSAIYEKKKMLSRNERFREIIWLMISLFPSKIQKVIVNHIEKIKVKSEQKIIKNMKNYTIIFLKI